MRPGAPRGTLRRVGYLILAGIAVLYVSSWWWHPIRRCPKCKGESRLYGALHRSKWRFCHVCEGSGRAPRIGAKILIALGLMTRPYDRTGGLGWYLKNRRR